MTDTSFSVLNENDELHIGPVFISGTPTEWISIGWKQPRTKTLKAGFVVTSPNRARQLAQKLIEYADHIDQTRKNRPVTY